MSSFILLVGFTNFTSSVSFVLPLVGFELSVLSSLGLLLSEGFELSFELSFSEGFSPLLILINFQR